MHYLVFNLQLEESLGLGNIYEQSNDGDVQSLNMEKVGLRYKIHLSPSTNFGLLERFTKLSLMQGHIQLSETIRPFLFNSLHNAPLASLYF